MMELLRFIADLKIPPTAKVVLCGICTRNGENISAFEFCKAIHLDVVVFNQALHNLLKLELITASNKTIKFAFDGVIYSITLNEFGAGRPLKRTPTTPVTKARTKLENMRLSGFIGQEMEIYKLSLEYDRLFIRYTNKMSMSIPMTPSFAKKTKNWELFKRLLALINDRKFNKILFLKAQFEAMKKSSKKYGVSYPYVSMLISNWAIDNYIYYIKTQVDTGLESVMISSEDDVINEVLMNSHYTVLKIKEANPELSFVQCIMTVDESLSPLYLVLNKDYLKYLNTTHQELSEDITNVLLRLKKDKHYRDLAVKIHKNLPEKL